MMLSWLAPLVLAFAGDAKPGEDTPDTGSPEQPPASAEPTTTTEAPAQAPPAAEPIDWTHAPPPDQASGIERDDPSPDRPLRKVTRALLLIPRWLVWGVAQPVRAGVYVYDRYSVRDVYDRTFYSKDHRFGMYPTAMYESGFGFTGGLRVVHHDALGANERVKLRATFGGRYWFGYGVNLRSGDRLGERVEIEFDFGHQRRPNERFFGIGNLDVPATLPDMPADPYAVGAETRFREDTVRGVARTDVKLIGPLEARMSGAMSSRVVGGTGERDSIDKAYMTDRLVGWDGVENLRVETELVYDSRRPTNPYLSSAIDATGWYATLHAGTTRGFEGDPSSFESFGGEVQRYFDLYRGSRVLAIRAFAETVAGDGPVSFLDLPRLGGTEFLRGYPNGRFRDRAVTLGSAEYTWDLGNFLAAYTFVDVGRVWPSLRDISTDDLRVGYGGGLQVHTGRTYVGRAQLAASIDGHVFLELVLSPAFPRRERVGRF